MPALVTDIRQLRKRRLIPVSEPTPDPQQVAISFEPTQRATPLDVALDRLQTAYPALKLLIDTLDLEPISITQAPGHSRLWDLAGQSLEGNRTYTKPEAIERIRIRTSVTQERAEKGFALMLESKAIEPVVDALTGKPHTELFYLSGSTPY